MGALLAALVASQPVSGHGAHAASGVPKDVFVTLDAMNSKLKLMIDKDLTGSALKSEVKQVKDLKIHDLVIRDFAGQKVFGVGFASVFVRLDAIDVELQAAIGDDANGHENAKRKRIKTAKAAKDGLEALLLQANQAPPSQAPEPNLKPIHAVFTPAPSGQHCSPPPPHA